MRTDTSEKSLERHIGEARTYSEMGLKDEARIAYEAALGLLSPSDPRRGEITGKLRELLREMGEYKNDGKGAEISVDDLSQVGAALQNQEDVSPILAAARALRAKNFWGKAAEEYEKLLGIGYPASTVIPEYIACLVKEYPDRKIIDDLLRISTGTPAYSNEKKASLLCLIGMELGNQGMHLEALHFVFTAYQQDPNETQYQRQLIRLTNKIASAARYAHLVSLGMVNAAGLQKAALLAAKEHKSIEWALIRALKVSKQLLLSALGQFYLCSFIPDATLPKTVTFLSAKVQKEDLLAEGWVPFVSQEGVLEVWLDDPGDDRRMGWIKSRLDVDQFQCRVALREDIHKMVETLYLEPGQQSAPESALAGQTSPIDLPDATESQSAQDKRRHLREHSSGPELLSAQFFLRDEKGAIKEYNLKVENHTRNGLGLLVTGQDLELLSLLKVGDVIHGVAFYSGWAMIRVDAVIKHRTRVEKGGEPEAYIFGVESNDLI